nr:MAG TPA: hypothetical protein [Bacteriophage sp.]
MYLAFSFPSLNFIPRFSNSSICSSKVRCFPS